MGRRPGPLTPIAYADALVFSTTMGLRFTPDGEIVPLTEAEVASLREKRRDRQFCLFSDEWLADTTVDFDNPPPLEDLTCYTPDEYYSARP